MSVPARAVLPVPILLWRFPQSWTSKRKKEIAMGEKEPGAVVYSMAVSDRKFGVKHMVASNSLAKMR